MKLPKILVFLSLTFFLISNTFALSFSEIQQTGYNITLNVKEDADHRFESLNVSFNEENNNLYITGRIIVTTNSSDLYTEIGITTNGTGGFDSSSSINFTAIGEVNYTAEDTHANLTFNDVYSITFPCVDKPFNETFNYNITFTELPDTVWIYAGTNSEVIGLTKSGSNYVIENDYLYLVQYSGHSAYSEFESASSHFDFVDEANSGFGRILDGGGWWTSGVTTTVISSTHSNVVKMKMTKAVSDYWNLYVFKDSKCVVAEPFQNDGTVNIFQLPMLFTVADYGYLDTDNDNNLNRDPEAGTWNYDDSSTTMSEKRPEMAVSYDSDRGWVYAGATNGTAVGGTFQDGSDNRLYWSFSNVPSGTFLFYCIDENSPSTADLRGVYDDFAYHDGLSITSSTGSNGTYNGLMIPLITDGGIWDGSVTCGTSSEFFNQTCYGFTEGLTTSSFYVYKDDNSDPDLLVGLQWDNTNYNFEVMSGYEGTSGCSSGDTLGEECNLTIDVWYDSVENGYANGYDVVSSIYQTEYLKIDENAPNIEPVVGQIECYVDGGWKDCANNQFYHNLEQVRGNCTDSDDGEPLFGSFTLIDEYDSNHTQFQDKNGTSYDGTYYIYDNSDINVSDSGYWSVEFVCGDSEYNMTNTTRWLIDWGTLTVELITPATDINVVQNDTFEVEAKVTCVGGECDTVSATLDPYQIIEGNTLDTSSEDKSVNWVIPLFFACIGICGLIFFAICYHIILSKRKPSEK